MDYYKLRLVVIAAYFGILMGVVWWVVKRSKNESADYFLAGRNLSGGLLGLLFLHRTLVQNISWVWPDQALRWCGIGTL